jgi:IS30 family transposase
VIIENRLKNRESITAIAKCLSRDRSTIWREVKYRSLPNRNNKTRVNGSWYLRLDGRKYRSQTIVTTINAKRQAYRHRLLKFQLRQSKYQARKAQSQAQTVQCLAIRHKTKLQTPDYDDCTKLIEAWLKLRWSPEQISLRLKLRHSINISHNIIYRFIRSRPDLVTNLRRRGRAYRFAAEKRLNYNQTNRLKHTIHDRPEIVDSLGRYGDLEGDTIVGKDKKDRLLTHVDRLAGIISIGLVKSYNASKIQKQTTKDISRVFNRIHTVTYDNGNEFSYWAYTEKELEAEIYFADPYKSSQRGRSENGNSLVRDFYPKGTDFKNISETDILNVESLLNNRPRKRFNGLTPIEFRELLHLEC